MAAPVASGPQIVVSAIEERGRAGSSVTTLTDGRMVVTWTEGAYQLDTIMYRILNADGSAAGPAVQVYNSIFAPQEVPRVTALAGGGFAIAWQETGFYNDIGYRVYGADGAAVTDALWATITAGVSANPAIQGTADGGFMIAWADATSDNNLSEFGFAVMARQFSATGTPLGADIVRLSGTSGGDETPALAVEGTTIAVVWADHRGPVIGEDGNFGIYGRTLTDGVPGADLLDGGERLDTGPFRATGYSPDVAFVDGQQIVVWHDSTTGTDSTDILMRIGTGAAQRVNTTTADMQREARITALEDGGFAVVWLDRSDPAGGDIRVRTYDSTGLATSDDFIASEAGVNSAGRQFDPDVVALRDGRFMVTWSDNGFGGSTEARIFDPRTEVVTWTGAASGEQYVGTDFSGGDALNGAGGNDTLYGGAGGDKLIGGAGQDALSGGIGEDTMVGGSGNDTYIVDAIGDRVFETTTTASTIDAGGRDGVDAGISFALNATAGLRFVENLLLTGSANLTGTGNELANRLTGNGGNNILHGGRGSDTMIGGAGNDTYVVDESGDRVFETTTTASSIDAGGLDVVRSEVSFNLNASAGLRFVENLILIGTANTSGIGNAMANRLTGNAGDNILNGGGGNDTMTGGAGADAFVFNAALGAGNVDRITDFDVIDDALRLDNAAFVGMATGRLAVSAFAANLTGTASDGRDRILHDTDSGRLYFDADGTGAGARVQFATIGVGTSLTNADIFIF